jgi:site-specific DNA-cytosine methylase
MPTTFKNNTFSSIGDQPHDVVTIAAGLRATVIGCNLANITDYDTVISYLEIKNNSKKICTDINKWKYKECKESFDIIWASPECTQYSQAKTRGERDLQGADKCVKRVLKIINHFKPRVWFIENPQTGLLKERARAVAKICDQMYSQGHGHGKNGLERRERTHPDVKRRVYVRGSRKITSTNGGTLPKK